MPISGVIPVQFPFGRVVDDILPYAFQFIFIPHDMFPIITLPYIMDFRVLPHPFCHADFEPADNGTDGFGCTARGYIRLS